ncbi:MAG: hypothetical protein ACQEWV_07185 [Bacillota bacterium]
MPISTKTFPDGAQYRIEIPRVEGQATLKATFEEMDCLVLTIHHVSQGSGIMLQTDEEM